MKINRSDLKSHLLYHIMPLAGGGGWVWKRHVQWIKEVSQQFTGKLIVGIVTKGINDKWEYSSLDEVYAEFKGINVEFLTVPNERTKSEGTILFSMLEKIKTSDPNEVIFYGHSKGATYFWNLDLSTHMWAKAMFDLLFKNYDTVINALEDAHICGSFRVKKEYSKFSVLYDAYWFFSGTFYAIRSCELFKRNWRYLPLHYGCVEKWPRLIFKTSESKCLFFDDVKDLYDLGYWKTEIAPALVRHSVSLGK